MISSLALALPFLLVTPAHATWTDRLDVGGDLRYRNEWSITRPGDDDMRWRQRVRARLGLTATIVDDRFWAGARLRTGNPSDQNSPHQTLGSGFTSFEANFDKVFMRWDPGAGHTSIWAGKFSDPFYDSPVYSDLILDNDVNPEGVAADIGIVNGDGVNWSLKPAAYLLLEVKAGAGDAAFDTDDGYMLAAQSQLDLPVGDGTLTVANAFYGIPDVTPADDPSLLASNESNATNAAGTELVEDFYIVDSVLGAELPVGETKLKLGARFGVNLGADSDNIAWEAGAKLPWDAGKVVLEVFGDVHGVGQEAYYSDFVADDHQVATGYIGGVAGLTVKPVKALGIRTWGIFDRSDTATDADPAVNSRLRVDVNAKF